MSSSIPSYAEGAAEGQRTSKPCDLTSLLMNDKFTATSDSMPLFGDAQHAAFVEDVLVIIHLDVDMLRWKDKGAIQRVFADLCCEALEDLHELRRIPNLLEYLNNLSRHPKCQAFESFSATIIRAILEFLCNNLDLIRRDPNDDLYTAVARLQEPLRMCLKRADKAEREGFHGAKKPGFLALSASEQEAVLEFFYAERAGVSQQEIMQLPDRAVRHIREITKISRDSLMFHDSDTEHEAAQKFSYALAFLGHCQNTQIDARPEYVAWSTSTAAPALWSNDAWLLWIRNALEIFIFEDALVKGESRNLFGGQ